MTNDGNSLLRSIGNRFRRPDIGDATHPLGMLSGALQDTTSFAQTFLPSRRHTDGAEDRDGGMMDDETSEEWQELYDEDTPLALSLHALYQMRQAVRHLCTCAEMHAQKLESCAQSQRALGDALRDALMHVAAPPGAGMEGEEGDGNEENEGVGGFSRLLSDEAADAQTALGKGLCKLAEVSMHVSGGLASPMHELRKSFESRYDRKITPLRTRYTDQKRQYLKYQRMAGVAEGDEKRSYFEALADAARPVWSRTSAELRVEADVMTELTVLNVAQWSRRLAMQHERALAVSASNMVDAIARAKEMTSLGKSGLNDSKV